MQVKKQVSRFMFCTSVTVMLALAGCSGGGGGGGSAPATGSAVSPSDQAAIDQNLADALSTNLVAVHDSGSASYNSDCVSCHGNKSSGTATDGRADAHAAMMPWASGSTTNAKCVWCHEHIVLETSIQAGYQSSGGNGQLRQKYSTSKCLLCHGLGADIEFYAQ